jgi:beta-lactamase regulating signal transducer with metallopeptidase domain
MMAIDFQYVAHIIASRGLNTVIEGLLLAGLSWGVLYCFSAGRSGTSSAVSSMTRFAVWFSTLLVIAVLPLLGRNSSPMVASNLRVPELMLSSAWAMGLFVAWAVISGALLIRLGFSLWHVSRLRRECSEIDAGSHAALIEVVHEFSRAQSTPIRRVKLLVSDDVRVPTALGFLGPAVVLPTWALRDLSADELRMIVLHELAHLRRWDDWTNLAQKFVKALFFFHPAVWWIDSRLALEREIACDDMVLEQTANARTYAASLVSVAEKVVAAKMRMGRALAQNALGRVREVSLRVAQILDTNRARTNRGWRPALAMIGTLAVVTVGAVPYAPELISFQGKVQPVVMAGASGVGSVPITAASLRWAGEGTRPYVDKGDASSASLRTVARRSTVKRNGMETSSEHLARRATRPTVIPAKAVLQKKGQKPHVIVAMTKASDRTQSAETLLVWHSTQIDESESNSVMWTLTVWRVTTADGEQRTFQETIVMNSL